MDQLWRMTHATFDVRPSAIIGDTIIEAIEVAKSHGWHDDDEQGALISFKFNGVTVSVRGDSDVDLIYRDWHRALKGYTKKRVGPYPKVDLSEEEKANDTRIEALNEQRRQEHDVHRREEQRRQDLMLEGALSAAPEKMTIRDKKAYRSINRTNSDPYGQSVIHYAETWARLMEARMTHGDTLEACADEASHLADNEGISGAMYGFAVNFLAKVWVHGDQLRKWHNKKFGVSEDEEGTVNPSIIRVSLPGPR